MNLYCLTPETRGVKTLLDIIMSFYDEIELKALIMRLILKGHRSLTFWKGFPFVLFHLQFPTV